MAWWAFDIETSAWDVFVHGSALCEDGRLVHMSSPDQVARWYLDLPSSDIVWSFNGGAFDFVFLISATKRQEWAARMAGGSIISCRVKGGAECRDAMRLFPGSLATWTGKKEELGLPCSCGDDCGGYCSIRPGMSRALRSRMVAYCDQDCRALLDTLSADLQRLRDEGLSIIGARDLPRLTFGTVAWHTAAELAGIDPSLRNEDWPQYDAGRRAYYGGRCEVGRTRVDAGHRYDVHAMYPSALVQGVPFGRWTTLLGADASRAYSRGAHGSYRAEVFVPRGDLPPLPHRFSEPRGQGRLTPGRLLWTTGTITGWFTPIELAAAENHGAQIQRIIAADTWSDCEPIFRPYVEMIYSARDRARAAGDKRWAGVLKWYANALSGKLAQHPDSESIAVIAEDDSPMRMIEAGWDHVAGRVWSKPTRRLSSNCRPIMAAYLTSRSRVKLLDRLGRHRGRWIYCDTDSTYLLDKDDRDVHESALGTWGYEGPLTDWLALAPKLYRYRDENGEPHVRSKGIPLIRPGTSEESKRRAAERNWQSIDELAAGATVSRPGGVKRLRSGGGTFAARTVERGHLDSQHGTGRCGTRYVESDGTTRPLHRTTDGDYV